MDLGLTPDEGADIKSEKSARKEPEVAPLLIHVGLHKTGSTWLQQDLFCNPDYGFTNDTGEPRQQIIMHIGVPDPLFFDSAKVASHYAPPIQDARRAGLTLALSHEQLAGHPSAGGRDRCIIADRLRATFPDARILFVFREQRSLIQSMYSQHITAGGVESLRRYLATPEPWCLRKPSFQLEFYEFDRMIGYYRDLFGPDRVLALPLELLGKRPQEFAERIMEFCGHRPATLPPSTPRNVRRPQLMQLVQRPLNMLFYHNDFSPGALIHIPRFNKRFAKYFRPVFQLLSPRFVDRWILDRQRRRIEKLVGDRYAGSNRRTQELIGLPLAEFGYPVD